MEQVVFHAGSAGLKIAHSIAYPAGNATNKEQEAFDLLACAYETAKDFVANGPPDSRLMKPVGYWLVLLTMLMEENLSRDLIELEDALEMISVSGECWQMLDVPTKKTQLYLAHQAVLDHFDAAQAEFSYVFEVSEKTQPAEAFTPPPEDEDFNNAMIAWFAGMTVEDQDSDDQAVAPPSTETHSDQQPGKPSILFYLCSWCYKPSAVLRKCDGCGHMRYCDRDCQRSHWPEHKKVCSRLR